MTAKRFSLTRKISGAVDKNEDDFLYSATDLARETRHQEVGNCWTYPTINSFETSLISRGLVSAPNEFEGSEWHITLNQTPGSARGLDFKRETPKFEIGSFGGNDYFGTLYFATGTHGAAVAETRDERDEIANILREAKKAHYFGQPYHNAEGLQEIYPDPYSQRQHSYEAGVTLTNDKSVKQFLQSEEVSAYASFAVSAEDGMSLPGYYYKQGERRNKAGDKIGDWIEPQTLELLDKKGNKTRIQELLVSALYEGIIDRGEFFRIARLFDSTAPGAVKWTSGNHPHGSDGAGHAVTVLGWDDNYIAPTANQLGGLLKDIGDSMGFNTERVDELKEWANSKGFQYTNQNNKSKGAWFIQNSWGKGDNEFQYLPYAFAEKPKTFQLADTTGALGRVESSASVPDMDNIIIGESIYEEIGYQFDYSENEYIAAIGAYIHDYNASLGKIRASLYRAGELDQGPIASTEFITPHVGYQTLRFASPISVEGATELVAVVSQDQGTDLIGFKLDAEKLANSAQTPYSSDQPDFYKELPLYYNNLTKLEGNSVAPEVYFGKNKWGWQDLAQSQEAVFINVVYANQDNLLSDDVDVITGSEVADKIFINDTGNIANAGEGNDTVYVRFTENTISLGDGNDTVIATEARGRDLVISGGSGNDRYVFALGKGNHFRGEALIRDFERGDKIHLYQFKDADLKSMTTLRSSTIFDFGSFELEVKGSGINGVGFSDGVIGHQ